MLVPVLTACAVESVEGDIADQQRCVAAQEVVREFAAGGSPSGRVESDLRGLAEGAADPELRSALTEVSEAYADLAGVDPSSPMWDERDRAVGALVRVCQRLSAF